MIKLYDIINESIERDMFEGFNEEELSEDYPVNFSLDEFKNIRSYSKKLKYARQYLGKPLGQGSSRVVYRVDSNKVLKLAKNKKGIEQNGAETSWYNDTYYDNILARVIDYDDENGLWVEMELAYRPTKADFKNLWGVDLESMSTYLKNRYNEEHGRQPLFWISNEIVEIMNENDNVQHLVSFMLDSKSPADDFGKISSWGIVHRLNGPSLVLIDFGLTDNIYQSYYK